MTYEKLTKSERLKQMHRDGLFKYIKERVKTPLGIFDTRKAASEAHGISVPTVSKKIIDDGFPEWQKEEDGVWTKPSTPQKLKKVKVEVIDLKEYWRKQK